MANDYIVSLYPRGEGCAPTEHVHTDVKSLSYDDHMVRVITAESEPNLAGLYPLGAVSSIERTETPQADIKQSKARAGLF